MMPSSCSAMSFSLSAPSRLVLDSQKSGIEPEVMPHLVEDGHLHLFTDLVVVPAHPLDRPLVDDDDVGGTLPYSGPRYLKGTPW